MVVIAGAKAGFWAPQQQATSTTTTAQAMTQVGSTLEYYITDRTKCWWDPNQTVTVKDGGVAISNVSRIDYAGGYVTLGAAPSGAVTVDAYYFTLELLGGSYEVQAQLKGNTKEVTTFSSVLNTPAAWKEFLNLLEEWSMTVKRHFFVANASFTTSLGTNKDLTWTWKASGIAGNAESVTYASGTPLEVARAGNLTTVTFISVTTTAAQVKAHLEADPTLSALWILTYPSGDGSGQVAAVASTALTGGRDSAEVSKMATKVLCVMYLNTTTGSIQKLEGVGYLTGISPNCTIESLVESDMTFQGTSALRFHTV